MAAEGNPVKTAAILAFALLAAAPGLAAAAPSPSGAAAPSTPAQTSNQGIENFGDWDVRCFPVKSASPCEAIYLAVEKRTHQRVTGLTVVYAPAQDRYVMQVAVPLGVSIADGLVIQTSTFTTAKLPFRRCDEGGCYIETAINTKMIDALKGASASEALLAIVWADGKKATLPFSLKGFGDAVAEMVKLARDRTKGS